MRVVVTVFMTVILCMGGTVLIMIVGMIVIMIVVVMVRGSSQLAIDSHIDLRRANAAPIYRVNVEFSANGERADHLP